MGGVRREGDGRAWQRITIAAVAAVVGRTRASAAQRGRHPPHQGLVGQTRAGSWKRQRKKKIGSTGCIRRVKKPVEKVSGG
jgi:hypothetical protein